jgi:hypothetical protein
VGRGAQSERPSSRPHAICVRLTLWLEVTKPDLSEVGPAAQVGIADVDANVGLAATLAVAHARQVLADLGVHAEQGGYQVSGQDG